jgi:hypothetical protein
MQILTGKIYEAKVILCTSVSRVLWQPKEDTRLSREINTLVKKRTSP